jgi:hypothetical protein
VWYTVCSHPIQRSYGMWSYLFPNFWAHVLQRFFRPHKPLKLLANLANLRRTPTGCRYVHAKQPLGLLKRWITVFSKSVISITPIHRDMIGWSVAFIFNHPCPVLGQPILCQDERWPVINKALTRRPLIYTATVLYVHVYLLVSINSKQPLYFLDRNS